MVEYVGRTSLVRWTYSPEGCFGLLWFGPLLGFHSLGLVGPLDPFWASGWYLLAPLYVRPIKGFYGPNLENWAIIGPWLFIWKLGLLDYWFGFRLWAKHREGKKGCLP